MSHSGCWCPGAGGWWKLDGMILYGLVACGTGMNNFFSFFSF
jgi:hypothetical protein